MVYIYGDGDINLSSNSRSRVWIAGYLHHVKKGNMMVMMMDLAGTYSPQQEDLVACFSLKLLFSKDVGV